MPTAIQSISKTGMCCSTLSLPQHLKIEGEVSSTTTTFIQVDQLVKTQAELAW